MLEGIERATRKRSSETSREILHVEEVLKEGLIKRIGSGLSVILRDNWIPVIWRDNWIPEVMSFKPWSSCQQPL
jgi:hypothetical protein